MRTQLKTYSSGSRSELHAFLLPLGAKPSLPKNCPATATWVGDLGDKTGDCLVLRGLDGAKWVACRVAKKKDVQADDIRIAAAVARKKAESLGMDTVCFDFQSIKASPPFIQAAAEGAGMACYDSGIMKENRAKPIVKKLTLCPVPGGKENLAALKAGEMAAAGNLFARDLQNLPANILTPKEFAKRARQVCRPSTQIQCQVLGEKKMAEMKMGSLLGVSQGSAQEAQLVHMIYKPKGKAKGRLALIGKGLTFDTGGISLKPSGNMWDMKFDMSGAAAVLGVFHALSKGAECPFEVHGILGCVENMPGSNAQRPGDIVTAMNGKTIEVLNTDAEGRLVLADCLAYVVKKVKPDCMYDMATLTGAAIHALGHLNSAVLGNNQKAIDGLIKAAEKAGESFWQLPMNEEYRDLTRGCYADLQNIYDAGQGAGTIAGACFLSFFVKDVPWVHLDIAATAWHGPSRPYMPAKGGRGVAARTMLEVLRG